MKSMSLFAAAILLAGSAQAADLGGSLKDGYSAPPPGTAVSWSGLYLGAHGGYGWGEWDGSLATGNADPFAVWANPNKSIDAEGWLAGGQVGYNLQLGSVVVGLEADASWSDINGSESFVTDGPAVDPDVYTWDFKGELEYFGTVRGRLGFLPTPNLLLYATGGYAWGKSKMSLVTFHENQQQKVALHETGRGSTSDTHHGWTAGLGGEMMLADNLTAKAEWLYVDLGKGGYNNVANGSDSFPADLTFNVFRIGVNYKFGR